MKSNKIGWPGNAAYTIKILLLNRQMWKRANSPPYSVAFCDGWFREHGLTVFCR